MTILVLVMLLFVWVAVLGPGLWRRRTASHSTDSIHNFHRALRVLQRTGDPVVAPVHRLQVAGPSVLRSDRASENRPTLLLVRPDSAPAGSAAAAPPRRRRQPEGASAFFTPDACRRRRDVLVALVLSVVSTGILGAVPTLRPLLVVMAVAVVALAGYLVLLVRLRTMAVERRSRERMQAAAAAARVAVVEEPEPPLVEARAAAR